MKKNPTFSAILISVFNFLAIEQAVFTFLITHAPMASAMGRDELGENLQQNADGPEHASRIRHAFGQHLRTDQNFAEIPDTSCCRKSLPYIMCMGFFLGGMFIGASYLADECLCLQ